MSTSIRALKRNYKIELAQHRALPTQDLGIPLPLSTGNPLFDAALTDKLVMTSTMSEAEHLRRAWMLVNDASKESIEVLAEHAQGILNDYKLLLALRCWREERDDLVERFLWSLPWGWRFRFPTAVIKPAAAIFTGWRTSISFRLVEDVRFDALKSLYRSILEKAPGVAILKYRNAIQEAAALLRYRFEGERERSIHDLCFKNGRGGDAHESLEPVGSYLRARTTLRRKGMKKFLDELGRAPHEIPITSYMGLLGNEGVHLTHEATPSIQEIRNYAVRCATPVESLLRRKEWGPWLDEGHAEIISRKLRESVIGGRVNIPFFKVTKAFIAAPIEVRKLLLEGVYLPLLEHFGEQTARLLPPPGPITFVQPGNIIHAMSFLLYTVLNSARSTRLLLFYKKHVEEVAPVELDEVGEHLADDPQELARWLQQRFGGLTSQYDYTYDFGKIAKRLSRLDPHAPIVLDLPFAQSLEILESLLPHERVFNLNGPLGAPGEISLAYQYYQQLAISTRGFNYSVWSREADRAAERFSELLDRLHYFQALAELEGGES